MKYSDYRERYLRLSETDLLRLPLLRAIHGQKAVSYRSAKLWCSLERETKLALSLKIFKEQILYYIVNKVWVDLFLFVLCFPAFFDLLISLGQ